jgi:hypothetical protein
MVMMILTTIKQQRRNYSIRKLFSIILMKKKIAILNGDGIGPEVTKQSYPHIKFNR